MPNHITNIITLHGEQNDIDRVLEAVKYDDIGIGSLDFEKVIPMPPELNIERGSRSDAALKLYNAFEAESAKLSLASILTSMPEADHNRLVMELCQKYEGDNKELFTLGLQMKKNIQKHGVADWYEWSINNWNTKWNSYGYDDSSEYIPGSNTITFLTAWSAPHALMDKLSVKYPSIAFEHKWADENFGHNTGWRTLQNGEMLDGHTPADGSRDAYEMAAAVMGRDLEGPGADYALSADETTYLYLDHQEHDLVSVKGHPAVFVEERLNESKIPKGLYLYYVQRSAPDSPFGAVTTLNSGNMCGSVITDTPVLVDQDGRYAFKSKEDGLRFTGTKATIKEYRGGEYDKKAVDALNTPATPKRQSSKSKPASRGR